MKQYLDFLQHILENGKKRTDRTGIGTISTFGYQMRFNLMEGFPLVTTKKTHFKSVVHELLWFLQGHTNVKFLQEKGVKIWDAWADKNGDLGLIYGYQWRKWKNYNGESIDQLSNILHQIKTNPYSRRLIISAWNVADLSKMALPPCHMLYQFYVSDGELSCMLTQRAGDAFLGVPFNIASYALLTHMVAQQCNLIAKEFIWSGGDCHIYLNHLEQVNLLLTREPYPLPQLNILKKPNSLFGYNYEDFELLDYKNHPAIKAEIAV